MRMYGARMHGRILFLAPGKHHWLDAWLYFPERTSWNPLVKSLDMPPCPFCGGGKETLCREKTPVFQPWATRYCHKQYIQSIYSFRPHYKYRFFASSYRSVEGVNYFVLPFLLI